MVKPLLVLVGGQPGSGKTTLARNVADELRIPHLNRDTIYQGYRFTYGERMHPAASQEVLFRTAAGLLDSGISIVLDMTMYRGEMEDPISRELLSRAAGALLFCQAGNAYDRFRDRLATDPAVSPEQLDNLLGRWPMIERIASAPLELGLPVVRVATDDGYAPGIAEVAEFARTARS